MASASTFTAEELLEAPFRAPGGLAAMGLKIGPGRKASQLVAVKVRELTVDDLIKTASEDAAPAPARQRLRQSHHQLARLLATGTSQMEVASITGYAISTISILKSDPQFQELLDHYKVLNEEQYNLARADMHKRLAAIGFDASEVLHERLLERPDDFDNKTLLAVVEAMSDRTGHGKTSTVEHKVGLNDQTIARIRDATEGGREVTATDREALLRIAAARTADLDAEAQEAEWEPCEGSGVREEGDPEAEEPVAD